MTKEVYVNAKKNKFTMVSNALLKDKNVTLQAKGLLSIFISNDTEKFTINMKEIITRSKNGRDAHYKVIDELIKHGYFARVEIREGGKFTKMLYIFSDDKEDVKEALSQFAGDETAIINPDKKKKSVDKSPNPENQDTAKGKEKPLPENQDTEIQYTENADTENQDINNTKGNNTKLNNTNINNINQSNTLNRVDNDLNEIPEEKMPMIVKKQISINQKRLIDDNIDVYEILAFYNSSDNTVDENNFATILNNVLKKTKGNIGSFHAVMKTSISKWYEEYVGHPVAVYDTQGEEIEPAGIDHENLPDYLKYDFLGGNN